VFELAAAGRIRLDRLPRTTVGLADVPRILLDKQSTSGFKVIVDVGGESE
jgi:hypothetical protein